MKEITPKQNIKASVYIPGSKSITNRVFILASLAKGKTKIKSPLFSDDTEYLLNALNRIGIKTEQDSKTVSVHGKGGIFSPCNEKIFVGNAGTTMRFLTSLLTLGSGSYILTGDKRMKERPIRDLTRALNDFGAHIEYIENEGYPPIKINAGHLKGGKISVQGNKSSQYISSLLMFAPLLENGIEINVEGDLVSKPYIDTTINVMQDFGVEVTNENYSLLKVSGYQKYQPQAFTVQGDASSASYFMAAASVAGGEITIENVGKNCNQGDIAFAYLLEKMGAQVKVKDNKTEIKCSGKLIGIECDLYNTPDIAQTLCVAALFASTPTLIKNIGNLRIKETDRITAMETELKKIGARIETGESWIKITPVQNYNSAIIDTYNDHRMAMSFAVAGLKIPGIKIKMPEVVSKSFPDFWTKLDSIS